MKGPSRVRTARPLDDIPRGCQHRAMVSSCRDLDRDRASQEVAAEAGQEVVVADRPVQIPHTRPGHLRTRLMDSRMCYPEATRSWSRSPP